jgi:hypothetical protein
MSTSDTFRSIRHPRAKIISLVLDLETLASVSELTSQLAADEK